MTSWCTSYIILCSITKLLESRVARVDWHCVYGGLVSHAQLVATHLWAKTRTQTARDPQIHQGCVDVWYISGRSAQMYVQYLISLICYTPLELPYLSPLDFSSHDPYHCVLDVSLVDNDPTRCRCETAAASRPLPGPTWSILEDGLITETHKRKKQILCFISVKRLLS